jgi:hypothetical protein
MPFVGMTGNIVNIDGEFALNFFAQNIFIFIGCLLKIKKEGKNFTQILQPVFATRRQPARRAS